MKIHTLCSTKKCKNIHTTITGFRLSEQYMAPPEPCFGCVEKKARKDAADDFVNEKRKS